MSVCRQLIERPESIKQWRTIAPVLEWYGDDKAAAAMCRATYDDRTNSGYGNWWANETERLYLKMGNAAAARTFESETWPDGPWTCYCVGYCWAQAQGYWIQKQRKLAKVSGEHQEARKAAAFCFLSMQTDPSVDELKALMDLPPASGEQDTTLSPWQQRALMNIALIEGDFNKADRLCQALSGSRLETSMSMLGDESYARWPELAGLQRLDPAEREAVSFLREHGSSLSGERSMWRRTTEAFRIPKAGWLLLTRDWRLGLASADLRKIDELPLPENIWWAPRPGHAILVSPSGQTVWATSGPSVFRLDLTERKWTLVARRPWAANQEWDMKSLEPVLDDLASRLVAADGRRIDFAWPTTWKPTQDRLQPFMLSDGTWVICNDQRLLLPRSIAEQKLGVHLEIYSIVAASSNCEVMYLLTDRGPIEWHTRTAELRPIALPGIEPPKPVTLATDTFNVPTGYVRLGLFPQDGGRTYLLCLSDGTVRDDQLINEAMPVTFWSQRSVEQNRETCREAFSKAHRDWPFGISATQAKSRTPGL